jgi:UDP-N-acetylglucosamine--N-acetylmuramyl-(pentapeptide) pyrophosphoryl-undecaprenol N-acetylglucosamine transferase
MANYRLVITGGHATPAIAVIEALKKEKGWTFNWIGEKTSIEGKSTKTLESQTLPSLGVPFHPLTFPKLHRSNLIKTLISFWKAPVGLFQSFYLLRKLHPDAVLTFGSYVSVPVALCAYLQGIPVVVHEQTAASGLANRLVGKFAKKVALSFEESALYFPKEKIVLTGNPIRQAFFEVAKKRARRKTTNRHSVIVLGGSRGSVSINNAVLDSLHAILIKLDLLHVTGELDYERVQSARDSLLPRLKVKYNVAPTLSFSQIEDALEKSSFAVARAGANTVSEFAAIGLPAIFIPLPQADSDEQTKNANILAKAGSAIVIPQSELSKEKFLASLDEMLSKLDKYTKCANEARSLIKKDAAERIAKLVKACI